MKDSPSLRQAVDEHLKRERASFHTPGHKGMRNEVASTTWRLDVTELDGLDELAHPSGPIAGIERRLSALWQAQDSVISVNGASAGIMAAMLSVADRGKAVLVPQNAHRSVINGLVLSGLDPLWYQPQWNGDWGIWQDVLPATIESALNSASEPFAAVVLVSPTYAGAVSDTDATAAICRRHHTPLIVDEAHGAHFLPGSAMPPSALASGADIVIHAWHKTLEGLTQTGVVHVGGDSLVSPQKVRSALRLLQTSSPSYPLLLSIEQALGRIEGCVGLERLLALKRLGETARRQIAALDHYQIYTPGCQADPARMIVKCTLMSANELCTALVDQGLTPEALLGAGVLLMLGLGSTDNDIAILASELQNISASMQPYPPAAAVRTPRPAAAEQVFNPRKAFLMPSEVVPRDSAVGRVAAEVIAPCPPGTPLVIPGQRVPPAVLEMSAIKNVSVVVD